jgi:hypothetical protein
LTDGLDASADDLAAVTHQLGRAPAGRFRVVVRRPDGTPAVIENAPWLVDGTPMPTTLWLVAPVLVRLVAPRVGGGGGGRLAPAAPPAALADAHDAYAARRDALLDGRAGPAPSGGVGGTRYGVKCLHAHLANHLCGFADPVGELVARELDVGELVPPPPVRDRLSP